MLDIPLVSALPSQGLRRSFMPSSLGFASFVLSRASAEEEVISDMDIHAATIARGSECTAAGMNVRIRVSFRSIQVFLNRNG